MTTTQPIAKGNTMKATFTKTGVNTIELRIGQDSIELRKARSGFRAVVGGRPVIGPKSAIEELFRKTLSGTEAGKAIVEVQWS